ncbi:MAG TPA: transglutaminase domain-containing protein [Candidatus Dormibacteraeota bacterium]
MTAASVSIGARPLSMRGSATTGLVALLLATTGWSVLAAGWTDSTPSVILVGIAGVLEGLLLARGRAPRLLALATAPLLLFVSLLPTSWASRPAPPSGGFANVVAQYAGAAVTGLFGDARWEFNIGLAALLWVAGAWAAWFAVRERRGAIATGPCWAVLAVNVINAPSTSQVTLPAALAACAAIMLIAAVHLDRLSDSWRRRRVRVLPGTDGRFAGAAAAGGVLVVVLALVIPPLSSTDISGRLFGFGSGSSGTHGRSTVPGLGGAATVRFNASTIPGGALTLSNSLVFTYKSSLATGVYLRMATDGTFASGNWLPDQSANNNGDDTAEVVVPGPIPRDRLLSDGAIGGQQHSVSTSVTVIDDTSDANTIPFAGEPDTTSVSATVSGLTGPEAPGQLLTVDSVDSESSVLGKTVVTSATESTATTDQLRRAGSSYPTFITRNFLDLRDDNTGGVAMIRVLAAQWTRSSGTPYDKATAIESNLRNPHLFKYTLKPPVPPASKPMWPVTYFLTTSHSGYCQYFAAAMGAMLRAVGIPARLVNGYGPGTSLNAESRGTTVQTNWNVSSKDAHTWVEAYFPGYGWIPFEPTPPSPAGDYQPFPRGPFGQTGTGTNGGSATAVTPRPTTATPAASVAPGSTSDRASGPRAALVALGAIAAMVLATLTLFAAWFLRPRDIRGIWRRVGVIGRLVGVKRDRSLTFDEYVARLSAALRYDTLGSDGPRRGGAATGWRPRIIEALRDIAAISDRAFYSHERVRSEEAARMKAAWRRVALLAPRLGRRALVRPEDAL